MAIKYKIKKFVNRTSDWNGYYYGRATMVDTMDLDDVAALIERNCSMKKSDVKAVLTEMIEVLHDAICSSQKVVLDGLGTFKPGLRSKMCESTEEFNNSYIKGCRVAFCPEYTVGQDGSRSYALLEGVTVEKYDEYDDGVNDNTRS